MKYLLRTLQLDRGIEELDMMEVLHSLLNRPISIYICLKFIHYLNNSGAEPSILARKNLKPISVHWILFSKPAKKRAHS
jgi:hypothetical protein